ncbi:hypothetical protein ACG873_30185 [Mesorhizobium sp. AaZ16]|uniref:hypothetical protein n=1 Tax=Mesorhizobium sp. AaZ16 TaxID=3402289 RepID=UPI00374FBA6E
MSNMMAAHVHLPSTRRPSFGTGVLGSEMIEFKHVRGQGFWDNWRGELTEALAHQGWHFRRLPLDEASGAV